MESVPGTARADGDWQAAWPGPSESDEARRSHRLTDSEQSQAAAPQAQPPLSGRRGAAMPRPRRDGATVTRTQAQRPA
jgi:hypothetical protein